MSKNSYKMYHKISEINGLSLYVYMFCFFKFGPSFSKDASVPEASDRKRKVRPGRRGVDAYGQLVPGILGAEDGDVEDFEDEVAGMGGTEMEVAWLKWG